MPARSNPAIYVAPGLMTRVTRCRLTLPRGPEAINLDWTPRVNDPDALDCLELQWGYWLRH